MLTAILTALPGNKAASVPGREATTPRARGREAATTEVLTALRTRLADKNRLVDLSRAKQDIVKLMAQGVRIFENQSGTWEAKSLQELSGEE